MVEQTDKPDLAPGKYDDDGFYIFEEGGFLDPHGVYFDKDGFDVNGGQYDDQGFYVPFQPAVLRKGKNQDWQKPESKIAIEAQEGAYDEDGFFILANGCFYDPHGFFFDKDGIDEAGGTYDNEGYYISPEHFDHDDFDYGDEEGQDDDQFERQAILQEHIVPGIVHASILLEKNPEAPMMVKISGIPNDTLKTENDFVTKVLKRRIANFKAEKILLKGSKQSQTQVCYIVSKDKASINSMLRMHETRCQLGQLRTWLMGFQDYLDGEESSAAEMAMIYTQMNQQVAPK